MLVKPGLPHDEPETVDLDPGARKCAVRTLLAPQHARIKIDGLRLVGWNPDFTNAPGHGDDDARFYDRAASLRTRSRGIAPPSPL